MAKKAKAAVKSLSKPTVSAPMPEFRWVPNQASRSHSGTANKTDTKKKKIDLSGVSLNLH